MMPAAKAFDPVIGIDIHIVQPPGPVPPVPIPHPFVGMLFDPFEFVPIIGATITVNGMPRAIAGTAGVGMPPHIPIGGVFVKPPTNECEMFMGSATVSMDGDAASYMALPALSCQDIGMPAPPRMNPKKKSKAKSLLLPTSVVLPIPMGAPVLIGGPPTISLMALGMRAGIAGLGRLARSGLGRRMMRGFRRMRRRVFRNLPPGFVKCNILRAEPVNAVTGEVVVEQQDFALPWRIPIDWTRRYSTAGDRMGACGHGWETPADARLEIDDDGSVTFFDGSPGAAVFPSLPAGKPVMEFVNGSVLERSTAMLVVRQKGGLTFQFAVPENGDRELPVRRIVDRSRNWIEFVRSQGILQEIRCSSGQRLLVRAPAGRIEQIYLGHPGQAKAPMLVAYEYDPDGNLVTVHDQLNAPYRFAYDQHRLVSHTDRNGLSFQYEYDNLSSQARCIHAFGDGGLYDYRFEYFPMLGQTRVTDSLGNVSILEYDSDSMVTREVDALGGSTLYQYDEVGRTTAVIDPMGRRTGYSYDARGNLLRNEKADGSAVVFEYDGNDLPTLVTDPNGHPWLFEWDERGLLRKRSTPKGAAWSYEHNDTGDLTGVTDPIGNATTFTIDGVGYVTEVTNALGGTTKLEVDAFGLTTTRTDPAGYKTEYHYDAKGRLVAVVTPEGKSLQCQYDREGNIIAVRDEAGNITQQRYVGLGEVAERVQPDSTRVRYEYDTEERLIGIVNERGEEYRLSRDQLGRVIKEVDYWGQVRTHRYDKAGRVVRTVEPSGRGIDFTYDPMDRLIGAASDDGLSETYAFDANGNLVLAANETIVVKRVYDEEGSLVEEAQGDFVVESVYDARGARVERRSSNGNTLAFENDALGNAIGIDLNGAALARIGRNNRGLRETEELAGGLERSFRYDANGRQVQQRLARGESAIVDRSYAYDPAGNLQEMIDVHKGQVAYLYDPMGRVRQQINPQGSIDRFLRDPAGSLSQPVAGGSDRTGRTERYKDRTYRFDAAGNLVRRSSSRGEATFRWNAANQLIGAVTEHGEVVTFGYDALGRRVFKEVDGVRTRYFWDLDVLLSDEADAGHPREFVFYPSTFEPLASVNGQICFYQNDPAGIPHEIVSSGGVVEWSGRYDAHGELVEQLVSTVENPLRFQGQYYDRETGLCYNRFRYYDPAIESFISRDPLGLAAGPNLYRYAPNVWSWIDPIGLACTPSQAANKVRRGQGPRGISRIDPPRVKGEQWHAHFGPGEGSPALNIDGTWKHGGGTVTVTRAQADFLRDAGWNI